MKLIFTEGTQFDAASLQGGGGSGLGLWSKCSLNVLNSIAAYNGRCSVSKRIVNLHGGRIGATSTLNEVNCCFKVSL